MKLLLTFSLLIGVLVISCKETSLKNNLDNQKTHDDKTNVNLADSLIVYETENLIIKKLSNHIYEHISYKKTNDFGNVACNGMLVINENEGILFDTPTDNNSSFELIDFITNKLKCKITALIPTHFHDDSAGGIAAFENNNIPIYATKQTIELIKENGQEFSKPVIDFDSSLTLNIGNKKVYAEYFGEGHTKDNIVGYVPDENAVFGGCLIKEVDASKGYLGDANIKDWSKTVEKVKLKYPNAKIVIPGHGAWGDKELFEYTIKLFK